MESTSGPEYLKRYEFDVENEQVRARQENTPVQLTRMQLSYEGNTLVANIPALATGAGVTYPTATPENESVLGRWDRITIGDEKWKIKKAILAWETDPIVFKCIDLLSKWANTRIRIVCENDTFKTLLQSWIDQAMGYSFRCAFFLEYFRTSYVPIFKTLIRYVPRNYKNDKIPQPAGNNVQLAVASQEEPIDEATKQLVERDNQNMQELIVAFKKLAEVKQSHDQGLASQERVEYYERQVAEKQATWMKGFIPGSYTILDPVQVDIDGPKEMSWLREPYLNVSTELQQAIKSPNSRQQDVVNRLPREIVRDIKAGENKIRLPNNVCTMVYGDKQPYEQYPTPMAYHAFAPLRRKRLMQEMDDQTINSIKNRILLVKIGSDMFPVFDPGEMNRIKTEFRNAGSTMTLFWNHTIELKWIEPDMKSLTDVTKYVTVNEEIRTVFGVNNVLTGTAANGGSIGNNQMNFKGVKAPIDGAQGKFCEFANAEIRMLKMALSIAADAKVEMDPFTLEDEAKFIAIVMQLYMNGLISDVEAHEELGYDNALVEKNLQKLQKKREKGIFMPTPSANNLGPDGLQTNNKPGGKGGTPTGGKPAGQPGADNNSSRTGQSSPPKKMAASLQMHDGTSYLVYDGEQLEEAYINDLMQTFGAEDSSRFVTASQFKAMTGKDVDFEPAWPQLNAKEVSQAAIASVNMSQKVQAEFDDRLKKERGEATGGKRAYVTEPRKQELMLAAIDSVGIEYAKTVTGVKEVPPQWDKHFRAVCHDVDSEMTDESIIARRSTAYAMCAKRLNKQLQLCKKS